MRLLNLLLILSLASCSKKWEQNLSNSNLEYDELNESIYTLNSNNSSFDLDWEYLSLMPNAPGTPQILSPWSLGANTAFPDHYIEDRFQIDGWELLYNTFSSELDISPKFFILYNRYRGTARGFFYMSPITPIPSDYLSHSLEFQNTASIPLLNYAGNELIGLKSNVTKVSLVQPYKTFSTGTWYAAEFELNYIDNIDLLPLSNLRFKWVVNSVHVDSVNIQGQGVLGVKGNLTNTNPSNLLNTLLKGSLQASGSVLTTGFKKIFDDNKINSPYINSFFSNLLTGGINLAANGLLSIIFGSTSGNSSVLSNMNISANYTLKGTNSNNYFIVSPNLIPSGTNFNTYDSTLIYPFYQNKVGLFRLSKVPDVQSILNTEYFTIFNEDAGSYNETDYLYNPFDFKIIPNSYQIIFNPDVINNSPSGASIQNLEQNLVRKDSDTSNVVIYPLNYDFAHFFSVSIGFVGYMRENGQLIYYSPPVVNYTESGYISKFYLRIKFDVVPNNGSPTVTVIKTFKLNPIEQVIEL